MVTKKNLERELKKRGWGNHLDFAVSEFQKGKTSKEVFRAVADKDANDFVENLENPQEMYLPESYLHNESEVVIAGKEKKKGYIKVRGNVKITPKCQAGLIPHKDGDRLGCIFDPEETPE